MTFHRFGQTGTGVDASSFNSTWESYRSDVDQQNSPISLFDPDTGDVKLARQMADEMINVSGAEIQIYLRTDNNDIDHVFDEDADPTYWPPVTIKAFFKPAPLELELEKWGADLGDLRSEVVFSHRQLYERYGGRMLRVGDVLLLPYNAAAINPTNYRITNATPSGNFRYNWLYFTCQVEILTADITVRPIEDMPVEEHIKTNGVYRESL